MVRKDPHHSEILLLGDVIAASETCAILPEAQNAMKNEPYETWSFAVTMQLLLLFLWAVRFGWRGPVEGHEATERGVEDFLLCVLKLTHPPLHPPALMLNCRYSLMHLLHITCFISGFSHFLETFQQLLEIRWRTCGTFPWLQQQPLFKPQLAAVHSGLLRQLLLGIVASIYIKH